MRKRYRILIVVICAAVLTGLAIAADWLIAFPKDAKATYVGRETCAKCHKKQHDDWVGSHHDLAMDLATPETVLADFENQQLTYFDITAKMFRRGDKFLINTEGPDGKMADFEIKYVFGVEPLQQYMVQFDDGRVQVLRECWDTVRKQWFYQFPPDVRDEQIKPDDPLHWTKRASNWNHMCAECHSTNLQKNFDLSKGERGEYATTFSEIDVSCETCHGPGSIHVELAEANSLFWDRNLGYGLPTLKDKNTKVEIESCAKCHSRRRIVHPNYRSGEEMLDHYAPSTLRELLYHPDGQILDEVYVYGSFLQSKMYSKDVRCTDCHDPHTTKLKHEGNKVCTSCHQHPAGKYDVPAHHHHKTGSKGALCVECHMPHRTYMVVDPRRDHSLRVPRPDLSVELGTPNACTKCHLEDSIADKKSADADSGLDLYQDWLAAAAGGNKPTKQMIADIDAQMAAAVEKWYGPKDRGSTPHFARAFAAFRDLRQSPRTVTPGELRGVEEALTEVLNSKTASTIAKATAVEHLAELDTQTSRALVISALSHKEPLIRATAIQGLEPPGQVINLRRRYNWEELSLALIPMLHDRVRWVRTEAAQTLASIYDILDPETKKELEEVLDEYRAGQLANGDQPEAQLNLGNTEAKLGRFGKAAEHYRAAIRLDGSFPMPRLYLGMILSRMKKDKQAIKEIESLIALAPEMPLARYQAGVIFNRLKRFKDAEVAFTKAVDLAPGQFDYRYALGVFYLERENWRKATEHANILLTLFQGEPSAQALQRDAKEKRSPAAN
jgi:predicted CXXCH cytochrome family protein